MERIQVWDYLEEYDQLRDEILAAVDKVFRSGRLILGESVDNFEQKFSSYCQVRHGVGVNSGTDALTLALRACGLGEGDEVLTVSNTAVPTVSAIVSAGGVPRFVDINPDTYLMDVHVVEAEVSERTKCLLPVHLYGQCVDIDVLSAIAERHGLVVLEDCAQSAGALYKGRKAGGLGTLSAHSFYPTKNLGAYGDGGLIATDDERFAEKARSLRMYGMQGSYYAEEHGYNSRLDEVQAEILSVKLKYLDQWIERRRRLAKRYADRLEGSGLILPKTAPDNTHTFYIYVVRHPERDRILERLKEMGIFLNVSYPFPIHTMRGYGHLGYRPGDLPVTEEMADQIFSLPMYPTFTEEQQDKVCDVLENILQELS